MIAALLLALAATAAPVSEAETLANQSDFETLFLKFSAAKPGDYPDADRVKLAKALLKGASAARKDPMIALGLAERAVILDKTLEALTLLGQIEIDAGQRSSAAEHLDAALKEKPDHLPALLARAQLAETEHEFGVAAALYQKAVATGAKGDVKVRLARATRSANENKQAIEELARTEKAIKEKVELAARNATKDWLKAINLETEKNDLAPGGVRKTEVQHFAFTYSTGNRDIWQMRDFEDKVGRLLEKAYDFVCDKLSHKIDHKTPVVLYTRAEFMSRYAGTPMGNAAGFWDGHQIVINGGTEIDEHFVQVMVHEFTHTTVTDMFGRGVPHWLNEGIAENMRLTAIGLDGKLEPFMRQRLAQAKKAGHLPTIAQLDAEFAQMASGVELSYALSAVAVKILVDRRGMREFLDLLTELGKGKPVPKTIEDHYMGLDRLEAAIGEEIG